jgi:ubiquinone/menaquinone biosynthesis C-methylase UbiE
MTGDASNNRRYYDHFAETYEALRGERDPGGYHDLLDELEADYVRRFGSGRDVLEVGCGTGLVLERIARFAERARGVDLSPAMLERARARGLEVTLASATELPFADASFDVTCAFKVLPHIAEIERALSEMARVTRPGGTIVAEFYNPHSLRGVLKRFGPAGRIGSEHSERDVFTRFDTPRRARELTPPGCVFAGARGVRILLPAAKLMRSEPGRRFFSGAERALCDTPLARFAGFYVAAFVKGANSR